MAVQISLRTCAVDEIGPFLQTCEAAFGDDARPEDVERLSRVMEPDRSLAAFDGDTMVGTTGAFSFRVGVPGGDIPAAGVTMVGVLPSHRRRGILTKMMTEQLADVHGRGEPVAILWASEASIYQRFGYGLATLQLAIDIDRARARWLSPKPPAGQVRLVGVQDAPKALAPVYDAARRTTPGMVSRTTTWWEAHRLPDPEHEREGAGPMFRAVLEIEGAPCAYALYRVRSDWSDRAPAGRLEVLEVVATTTAATQEIWSYLFGIDLVARVRSLWEPIDTPLVLMLEEPTRLRARIHDGLWLRIVDLRAALAARSYASAGSLTFEVSDELCPWNAGVWNLRVSDEVEVDRSDAQPELRLSIAELGAVYLGGTTFARMLAAGRLDRVSDGAVAGADELFRTERAPWCAEVF